MRCGEDAGDRWEGRGTSKRIGCLLKVLYMCRVFKVRQGFYFLYSISISDKDSSIDEEDKAREASFPSLLLFQSF